MMDLFSDTDVKEAREQGGLVRLPSGRRILLPTIFGFCGGVVRALHLLDDWSRRRQAQGTIHLLGPIIHNDTVNNAFRKRGVNILPEDRIEEIFALVRPQDSIALPAFGVPVNIEKRLREHLPAAQILDTTCQYVRRVWAFLDGLPAADWTVVVHGKPGHPETRATVSRAQLVSRMVLLVSDKRDAERLCAAIRAGSWTSYPSRLRSGPATAAIGPLAVVNQTTMLYSETVAIAQELQACAATAGIEVRLADTVCRATQERQNAAADLCARHPDTVLVVGSFSSSNTAQLQRLAAETTRAYFIDSASALSPAAIRHYCEGRGMIVTPDWLPPAWRTVGILAGASCPTADVGKVIRRLKAMDGEV